MRSAPLLTARRRPPRPPDASGRSPQAMEPTHRAESLMPRALGTMSPLLRARSPCQCSSSSSVAFSLHTNQKTLSAAAWRRGMCRFRGQSRALSGMLLPGVRRLGCPPSQTGTGHHQCGAQRPAGLGMCAARGRCRWAAGLCASEGAHPAFSPRGASEGRPTA